MKYQPKDKKLLLKAALGLVQSDLAITNVKLVNVITGEIYPADVYVYDGFISHVEYKECGKGLDKANKVVVANQRVNILSLV